MIINCKQKVFSIVMFLICIFLTVNEGRAQIIQESKCPNSDFSAHDFTNWNGCYGSFTNPCQTPGYVTTGGVTARHAILTPQVLNYPGGSIDSLTLNCPTAPLGLKKIPPGVNQVVRLGNCITGAQAERLTYNILVDTTVSGLFIYSFAPVLEDPGGSHSPAEMPKFRIRILNSAGVALTDPCAQFEYFVNSSGYTPNVSTIANRQIQWFNWRTVGMSLKPYHGQNITIEFTSFDCSLSGHFGYAYLYGFCFPRHIDINYCPGSTTAVLSGPNGFKYKWLPALNYAGGDTTQSLTVNGPIDSTVYQVVITSTSNMQCSDTLRTLLVPNIIHSNFTFSNACVYDPVQFNYTTTTNTPIYSWFWNFGDPGSMGNHMSQVTNPYHTFVTPGTYTVSLSDTLQSGCGDTMTKTITIYPAPVVNVTSDSICPGDHAILTASTSNNTTTYVWSDGFVGNPHTVSPTVNTTYTVIATDTTSCQDSAFSNVVLYEPLQISYTTDITSGCAPITVKFNNETFPVAATYKWEFGDNTTSTLESPSHTFAAGLYTITLTAISVEGCKSVSVIPNFINSYPMPTANFGWTPPIGVVNYPVNFNNLTTPPSSTFSYSWDFGDNTSLSVDKNPIHTYTSVGSYNILMIATTDFSCTDSLQYTIQIINDSLQFPNIITPNGDGHNDNFVIYGLTEQAYPSNRLVIFNRWGKKVFDANNYKNDFNGNGLPEGVYFYVFTAKGIFKEIEHKSSLQILR